MSDMAPCHYNGFVDGMSWDEKKETVCEKKKDSVLRETARLLCDFHVRQVFLSLALLTLRYFLRPLADECLRTLESARKP